MDFIKKVIEKISNLIQDSKGLLYDAPGEGVGISREKLSYWIIFFFCMYKYWWFDKDAPDQVFYLIGILLGYNGFKKVNGKVGDFIDYKKSTVGNTTIVDNTTAVESPSTSSEINNYPPDKEV